MKNNQASKISWKSEKKEHLDTGFSIVWKERGAEFIDTSREALN